jgi:predicted RNase H-like HicB family nuclease
MTADVTRYSYFLERRASDKSWVATVAEFPDLDAESRVRNRALYDLQDRVAAAIEQLRRSGEPIPEPAHPSQDLLTSFGLTRRDVGLPDR